LWPWDSGNLYQGFELVNYTEMYMKSGNLWKNEAETQKTLGTNTVPEWERVTTFLSTSAKPHVRTLEYGFGVPGPLNLFLFLMWPHWIHLPPLLSSWLSLLKIVFIYCMCAYEQAWHKYESQRTMYGSWGWNSGHCVWWQVFLLIEPSPPCDSNKCIGDTWPKLVSWNNQNLDLAN